MGRYQELIQTLRDAQSANIDLLAEREHLRARAEKLSKENSRLRRQLRESSRDAQILRRAVDAAQYLAMMHLAGQPISRAVCTADGMKRSEWYWGRALLRDAGVHDGQEFTTDNIEAINAGIGRAVSCYRAQGIGALRSGNPNRLWRGRAA